MSVFEDQKDFMIAGEQEVVNYDEHQSSLYASLITEEYKEFICAFDDESKENQIKEACDILVVTIGWLQSQGINPQQAWNLVHENNMAKVNNVEKDTNGKIKKSPKSIQRKADMMEGLRGLMKHD